MKNRHNILRYSVWLLVLAVFASIGQTEVLHVNGRTGDDANAGTQSAPLRTIDQAATQVNSSTKSGPAAIIVAPGLYSLERCVTFGRGRVFTEKDRLTIRASILPGDPHWKPEHMPILLSVENPQETAGANMPRETYSLKIQTSHVTVQGLRFLGNPSLRNWHCCIERIGDNLDDLLVTQCLFVGNRDTTDIYCAALATGDRFVVDHCVFSRCHGCTVFWDGLEGIAGQGCGMRYCVVEGASISAVWTCQTAEDFAFHHNAIANSEYLWMRKPGDRQTYRISDCALVGNRHFSGYGHAAGPTGPTGPEVRFHTDNVTNEGSLVWASDAKTHLVESSAGYDLGAGLFNKPPR